MTMTTPRWLGRREGGNLRGWVISLITVLIAATLIVAIAELEHRLTLAVAEQSDG